MTPNATPCSSWRLYVIVDRTAARGRALDELTSQALRGGADVIQLRDKTASDAQLVEDAARLLPLTRAAGVPLIINDRVEVARSVGADGVHLGQDDDSIKAARTALGPNRLIGTSTHSLEQALAADIEEADYVALGPIFPTPTKPESGSVGLGLIREVTERMTQPLVCIGGIDGVTVRQVLAAGARCIAVVRAVCGAEDPEAAARALKEQIEQFIRRRAAPFV